ncbi:hypothetical protein [Peribacillus simplex]|uniref:hypothetical protein n=1 Tax=Peribacillus simplex TaxID=1478 RepID=UPI003D2962CA
MIIDVDRCKVNKGEADERTTNYSSIDVDETFPVIRIEFDWYISYSVRNESFTMLDEYEEFKGGIFCIYSKSRYLDFVKLSTIASDFHPEPYKHYGINALNHIIDVVSTDPPTISLIERSVQNKEK